MKKIFFLIFLFAVSQNVFSQSPVNVYAGIGYNLSSGKIDPLDYVISRYNETRSYLTKKMESPSGLKGMSFSMGFYTSSVLIDFEYTVKRSSIISAEGTTGGSEKRRELKIYGKSFNTGVNYILYLKDFNIMPGLSFDWNFMPVESRVYDVNDPNPPDFEIASAETGTSFSNSSWQISPNVHIDYLMSENFVLSLKPYYSIGLTKLDYTYLNKNLNNTTYQNDPEDKTSSSFSSFGILLKLKYLFL